MLGPGLGRAGDAFASPKVNLLARRSGYCTIMCRERQVLGDLRDASSTCFEFSLIVEVSTNNWELRCVNRGRFSHTSQAWVKPLLDGAPSPAPLR